MSYDIHLEADLGGIEPVRIGDLDWNYTYNIRPMTALAGLPSLRDLDGLKAGEAADVVDRVLSKMKAQPSMYRALNPSNGWGDYDSFVQRLDDLVEMFRAAPAATVVVS